MERMKHLAAISNSRAMVQGLSISIKAPWKTQQLSDELWDVVWGAVTIEVGLIDIATSNDHWRDEAH